MRSIFEDVFRRYMKEEVYQYVYYSGDRKVTCK